MIHVSCGHEKGIGIEIFLKSFLCQPSSFQKKFVLHIDKQTLLSNLKFLNIAYSLNNNLVKLFTSELNINFVNKEKSTLSNESLYSAMSFCLEDKNSNLLTLPTSKDQLFFEGESVKGHTDLLRKYFRIESISMNFLSPKLNTLLLSDHVALSEVEKDLDLDSIVEKVIITLKGITNFRKINHVIFSGINPHNGENGLISNRDDVIGHAIGKLNSLFKGKISFKGPYPGDTIHNHKFSENKLFVYSYHDQGLAPFKLFNGLIGVNLSLGLPFTRVSVDHGTAFDLYAKNKANYIGMSYLMNELRKLEKYYK